MKRMPLILPTLVALTLTGCNSTREVAYWTDSSYKSTLDYDAELKKELEDEIGSVHNAIQNIINNNMNNLESGGNLDASVQEPQDDEVVLNNASKTQCITYFRKYFTAHSEKYREYYLDLAYASNGLAPTGDGSPVITIGDKKYINIVNISTISTVSDTDYYNYTAGPFSMLFTEESFANNPNGITMDYATFKAQLVYALDYFVTGESIGIS